MTICSEAADPTPRAGLRGCVLVGLGPAAEAMPDSASPLDAAATELATLLAAQQLHLRGNDAPQRSLAALLDAAGHSDHPWVAALPVDVGRPLADGSCWAEALGAWRQATVLLIPASQRDSGLPAAGAALLRQWRVPLLGLLQWGGSWQPAERQRDGLPWLGLLPGGPQPGGPDGAAEAAHVPEHDQAVAALRTAWWLRLRHLSES